MNQIKQYKRLHNKSKRKINYSKYLDNLKQTTVIYKEKNDYQRKIKN